MIILTQKNYNFDEKRYKREQFKRAVEEATDAKIVTDKSGNIIKKIGNKKVIIPVAIAATLAGGGAVGYKHYKNKKKEKAYSQEEEIAQIPADPGTEEYSHLRAAIEKKPSQQAAQINEQYEVQEKAIKKSGVEEKLAGEGKEVVNNETRQKREANLDNRDASLDTLNQFLGGIK